MNCIPKIIKCTIECSEMFFCCFSYLFGSFQNATDKILLIEIEEISGGTINPGDQIVKIGNDDITTWALLRGTRQNQCFTQLSCFTATCYSQIVSFNIQLCNV